MATKLGVWNGGLIALGHRALSDTGEAVEAGRLLTTLHSQLVNECLSVGSWNFAMETIESANDTGVTPSFGYTKVFAKPSDWVRTIAISLDEHFTLPLLDYYDDPGIWSADSSPIYVRYVSNDTGLGFELTTWPALFTRYVELEFASRACMKLTQNSSLQDAIDKMRDKARRRALNADAMNEPQPKYPPSPGWTMARGGRMGRNDRGSRGSLTG